MPSSEPFNSESRPPRRGLTALAGWLRTAWAGPVAPVPDATAAALSFALGLSVAAHAGHFALLLKRLPWFAAFMGLAVAVYPIFRWVCRAYLFPRLRLLPTGDRLVLPGLALGLALALVHWWSPILADNVWIHEPGLRPILSSLLSGTDVLLLAFLYGVVLALPVNAPVVKPVEERGPGSGRSLALAVTALVVYVVAGNLFVRWYVGSERALYYWDYAGYWRICIDYAGQLTSEEGRVTAVVAFQDSIKDSIYTLLPAAGPSCVMSLFGTDRLTYVLAVFNLYLVSVLVASIGFARSVARPTWLTAIVPLVVTAGFPLIWTPLLRGMPDVGGVALALVACGLYLSRPTDELSWKRLFLIALTLVALALFRKWFNYWILAFGLCIGLEALYRIAGSRPLTVRAVWLGLRPAIGIGLFSLVLLLSFSLPMVRRIAGHDYAWENIGWHSGRSEGERVLAVLEYVGFGYVGLWLVCVVVLIAVPGYRRIGFFAVGTAIVGMGLFLRVQEPWPHHYQLLAPPFLIAVVAGLCLIVSRIARVGLQLAVVGGLALAYFVAMETTFVPEAEETWERLRPVVPAVRHPPLVRGDLDEFRRLMAWLDHETAGTEKRYCVLASSDWLNQTMFFTAEPSLREPFPAAMRIAVLPEKDRLDGFPSALFLSDFVFVADPPQTHLLRPGEQAVVMVPVESFQNGLDMARAFEKLPETFEMDRGITLHVYRKTRPIRDDELQDFCERLRAAHPDIPKLFTPPPEVQKAVER